MAVDTRGWSSNLKILKADSDPKEWFELNDLKIFFLQGADHLDILHCEVYCDSLPQVQRVWTSLSAKLQSEEQSVRIVALWDGFAQEEQMRCCKIIVSIEGSSARDCFCSVCSRADIT